MAVKVLSGTTGSVAVLREELHLDDPRVGVVYGSTANQAAKVQSALDLAASAVGGGGGTVFAGSVVRLGNTEIIWPSSGGGRGSVRLRANGEGSQFNESGGALYWDQDSPDAAPLPGDHAGTRFGIRIPLDAATWRIEDICLQGPGDSVPIGSMPCKMYGVFVPTRGHMDHVVSRGWGAGVGIINDHQHYSDCDFGGNGYGLDFMDNSLGGLGDMLFSKLNLSGQYRASIAISDSNCIANARFAGNGHCGAAPFGIYRYAGQETARGQAMAGVVFENWSFEYCGNAMIYDEVGGAGWSNIIFDCPGEFATGGSAKWPGKPWPMAKIQIAYGDGFHWREGPIIPQADNPDQPVISAKDFGAFRIDDPVPLFDAIVGYNHKSFVMPSGGFGLKWTGGKMGRSDLPDGLVLGALQASEAIVKGSLVEMVGTNQVRESRNGLSSQIVGVSIIDYNVGDICVFVTSGTRGGLVVRNASGSPITNGTLMTPDPAHQGCVKAAASLNDLIVGRAHDGSIASGATGPIMMSL